MEQSVRNCKLSASFFIVFFFSYSIEPFCRGMSSTHAIFITIMSLYLVFYSDLFSDHLEGLVTFRSSNLSTFTLGVTSLSFILLSCNILCLYYWHLNTCLLKLFVMLHLTGFRWVFHHWPCDDILAISFSWWSGICK